KGAAVGPVNPAPVPTQTAPVNPRVRQQTPPAQVPAAGSTPEMAFAQHYSAVMTRAARARAGLAQWQRTHGGSSTPLPDDVVAARNRLEDQFQTVVNSMRARDTAAADRGLNDVEATLSVIEQFLAK